METQLKAARQAHGWSQLRVITELLALGTSRRLAMPTRESLKTQLSRWENGHVVPQEPYRTLLAEIFGVTADELGFENVILPSRSIQLSKESIDGMHDLLGRFVEVDNTVGPQQLFQVAAQQVTTLEPRLLECRGKVRRDGLRLCARFAEFAGWLGQDAGDLDVAQRWTDLAMDFTEEAGDAEIRAYTLMRKSNVAVERREFGRAITLASASCRELDRLSPRVQALALRQAAIAHAVVHDSQRSERAAGRAVEAIHQATRPADGFAYVTPAYVLMESGVSAFYLHRYDVASSRLASAVDTWPDGFARDRGLCLARLGVAEAMRGSIDVACDVGREALAAYRAVGSARVRATLVSLKQRLAPYDRNTFVSEFRQQLARL